jgi:hypothetical protein
LELQDYSHKNRKQAFLMAIFCFIYNEQPVSPVQMFDIKPLPSLGFTVDNWNYLNGSPIR